MSPWVGQLQSTRLAPCHAAQPCLRDADYRVLDLTYSRPREEGHDVARDAVADVMDRLENEGLVKTGQCVVPDHIRHLPG